MSDQLPKAYEPNGIETKWYEFWKNKGFFTPNSASQKPSYCIVIPPPNVTGMLHMGHALVNTLQDILIRWKRMSGFETLWLPGTDHAGIATQTVVERHLIASEGKKRTDFTRDDFLAYVWKWKDDYEKRIVYQLMRLGCSCDWSRQRFTMDEGCNLAVRTFFKKLFDEKLIYRGDYLVNWDPVTQTALADDEVEYEERSSYLWHLRYPLEDSSGYVTIATTRPETMLGDTAVAVSPKDQRYSHLIGKHVLLPLMNRLIPVIADHHVDPAFGTGVVKITPAHDPNDYQMGLEHHLPFINIMTPDGKINENGGRFEGLSMEKAREAVVEEMKKLGLLEKIEPHTNRVGVSYRSKATIEPYLSKQWFVKMDKFAKKLQEAVTSQKVKLIPKSWENTYFHWIDNLRDWCISRQLWWGHRIPIWYHKEDPDKILCFDGPGAPPEVLQNPHLWKQDDDVLDTWFSAGLWPFATLGWPKQTEDLSKFFPNSVLVTGHDILFFWVARMIFMAEHAMDAFPFPEVFLHGLIYGKSYWRNLPEGGIRYVSNEERHEYDLGKPLPSDVLSKWEKMSKTKGNVIDPLEIIEAYGTDALRMALCASPSQSRQIDLDLRRFEEFKNFTNKIWNGARFVFLNLDGDEKSGTTALTSDAFCQGLKQELLSLEDRWILSSLNRIIKEVNQHLDNYEFDQAALKAYDFFWKEFCAYYLEIAKPVLFGKSGTPDQRENKQKLLVIVLSNAIRLLHPMAPFITEELFQILKKRLGNVILHENIDVYTAETIKALHAEACIISPYPQVIAEEDNNPQINETFAFLEEVIYSIRYIRGEMKLSPGMKTELHVIGDPSDPSMMLLQENRLIVSSLVPISQFFFSKSDSIKGLRGSAIVHNIQLLLPLPPELQNKEKERLHKEQERLTKVLEKTQVQLDNSEFKAKAPAALIDKLENQLKQTSKELMEISNQLKNFEHA